MAQRSDWQPDNVNEPADADKDWDVDQKPPASWFNWFFESVVLDLGDLISAIFVDSGADTGRLKNPVEIATGGLSRVYRESGVGDFAVAYNAEFDAANDEWVEIDSNEANPSLIVRNPSLSGITGLSASDLEHETQYLKLEAASITSGVITWQLAGSEVGLFTSQAVHLLQFEDRSGDGSQWTMREDPGTGELEVDHPDFASPILIRQDGRISNVADGSATDDVATVSQTSAGLTLVGVNTGWDVSQIARLGANADGTTFTGADLYHLVIRAVLSSDATLGMRVSDDGGSSFLSATDYAFEITDDPIGIAQDTNSQTGVEPAILNNNDIAGGVPFRVTLSLEEWDNDGTTVPRWSLVGGSYLRAANTMPNISSFVDYVGLFNQAIAADGLEIFTTSDVGLSGEIRLYEVTG